MSADSTLPVRVTYVGGPTALIDVTGVRFLTDPTLDAAPAEYATPVYTLLKTESPAIGVDALGRIDAVLLSHDHHFDNLDRSGREFLSKARRVLTTGAGAERLGESATGLQAWDHVDVDAPDGRRIRITATPARHGSAGPLHFAGWKHFSEGRDVIQRAFDDAGLGDRLRWPEPGRETTI